MAWLAKVWTLLYTWQIHVVEDWKQLVGGAGLMMEALDLLTLSLMLLVASPFDQELAVLLEYHVCSYRMDAADPEPSARNCAPLLADVEGPRSYSTSESSTILALYPEEVKLDSVQLKHKERAQTCHKVGPSKSHEHPPEESFALANQSLPKPLALIVSKKLLRTNDVMLLQPPSGQKLATCCRCQGLWLSVRGFLLQGVAILGYRTVISDADRELTVQLMVEEMAMVYGLCSPEANFASARLGLTAD